VDVWVAVRSGVSTGRAFGYGESRAGGGVGDDWVTLVRIGVGLVDEGGDEGPFVEDG
jgi:hypothetical protein